jgi:ParB/RepB/Spo0J family partition protein
MPHNAPYGVGKNGLPLYPVREILADPAFNSRDPFPKSAAEVLAEKIRREGLLIPVQLRPIDHDTYKYHLVYGYRRFTAISEILGWEYIEAHCRPMSEDEASRLNFSENLDRLNLTILEEAKTIARLFPISRASRDVAQELNKPPKFVAIRRVLLTLPEEVQLMFASGRLPPSYIEVISRKTGPNQQIAFARELLADRNKLDGSLTRKGHAVKSSRDKHRQVRRMAARVLQDGFPSFCSLLLLWAVGDVTDQEFEFVYGETLKDLHDVSASTTTETRDKAPSGDGMPPL